VSDTRDLVSDCNFDGLHLVNRDVSDVQFELGHFRRTTDPAEAGAGDIDMSFRAHNTRHPTILHELLRLNVARAKLKFARTLQCPVTRYIRGCPLEQGMEPPQREFIASKLDGRVDPGRLGHAGSSHGGAG